MRCLFNIQKEIISNEIVKIARIEFYNTIDILPKYGYRRDNDLRQHVKCAGKFIKLTDIKAI